MLWSGHVSLLFFPPVPAAKLSVSPQAKEAFAMTKLHKDIAVRLIQCSEDEEFTDQATIKVPIPLSLPPPPSLMLLLTSLIPVGTICEDIGVDKQP